MAWTGFAHMVWDRVGEIWVGTQFDDNGKSIVRWDW